MKQTHDPAIQLTDISKKYEIHHEKPTLVEKFVKGRNETFWALKNVNLTVRKGEKIGVIGPNGSGKTTLLKIIAGITAPTSGKANTTGRVVSLIDLEAGFHPDLTGLQNITLGGAILGMNKRELAGRLDEILNFADIGRFIDVPLYTYSAGMRLRLGFALALACHPDIFLIDEVIAVGDGDFRIKCMNALARSEATVLLSSHELPLLYSICTYCHILNRGELLTHQYEQATQRIHALPSRARFSTTVSTQSMSGIIEKGDTIEMIKTPITSIRRGDIAAFSFPNLPIPIIHRVAEIYQDTKKSYFLTKGDASFGYDPWKVQQHNLLGKIVKINNKKI